MNNNKDYRGKILDIIKDKKYSILGNDLDSFISVMIMKQYANIDPVAFFDPEIFAMNTKYLMKLPEIVGLDMTFDKNNKLGIDTISNHVENFYGEEKTSTSISCNDHVNDLNYEQKSLFSTTLMLWSTFKIPLPSTKKGKMVLLTIDSTFKQFFNNRFKHIILKDLQYYGLNELIDVLNSTQEEEYEELRRELGIAEDIKYVFFNKNIYVDFREYFERVKIHDIFELLELELFSFKLEFSSWCILSRHYCTPGEYLKRREREQVFSYAIPYKRSVSYSRVEKIF